MRKIIIILLIPIIFSGLQSQDREYTPQPIPQEELITKIEIEKRDGIIASGILIATGLGLSIYSTSMLIENGVEDQNPNMIAPAGLSIIFTGIFTLFLRYFTLQE